MAKLPKGPVPLHKSMAVGEKLSDATSEAKVGGSKKDKSSKTNK
jgi:hypothetical protein